jgi:hypothetical protein
MDIMIVRLQREGFILETQYSDQQGFQPAPPRQNQPTNGKSIAALVLGILAVIIPYIGLIIGILAIVFGKISLNEIKKRGEQGKGLAIAGLVCGIVGTVLYAIIIIFLIIGLVFVSKLDRLNY